MIKMDFTKDLEQTVKTLSQEKLSFLYTWELVYDFFRFIEVKFPDMFYTAQHIVFDFYKKNISKDLYCDDFYDVFRELDFPSCIDILEVNKDLESLAYDYVKINILSFAWIHYSSIILKVSNELDRNIKNTSGFCVRFKDISHTYDSYLFTPDSQNLGNTIANHIISDLEELSCKQSFNENDNTFKLTIKENVLKINFRGVFLNYILLDNEEARLFTRCRTIISRTLGFNQILEGIEHNKLPHSILKYVFRYIADSSKVPDSKVIEYVNFSYLLYLRNNYCNFAATAIYYALLSNNIFQSVHEFVLHLDTDEEKMRQAIAYLDWFELIHN